MHKKTHNDTTVSETTRRKFRQHINRQLIKHRVQHEDNTAKGAQIFAKNKKNYEGTYDNSLCVFDGEVSAKRMQIQLTSLNMIKNLIGKEELSWCSDGTWKLDPNECLMMVMVAADKEQKFYPTGFVLKSHGDEESCQ